MSEGSQDQIDFSVDANNLYREESFTDLKAASIRKLIPIKADGTDDENREAIFAGHTQVMSQQGPIPIQSRLDANNLQEAMDAFPAAMKQALSEVVQRIREMQEQQRKEQQGGSNIITPGT